MKRFFFYHPSLPLLSTALVWMNPIKLMLDLYVTFSTSLLDMVI